MRPFLVGIAGGSGAGKTTLARALAELEPGRYAVVRLDDYYKADIPWVNGVRNWERPEAIDFDAAHAALRMLAEGSSVTVRGRMPQYDENQHRVGEIPFEYDIEPKEAVLFEGFLALHDARIRAILDLSLFLSIPIRESLARRATDPQKYNDEAYFRDILIPAHEEFVAPTEAYADVRLPVAGKAPEDVYREARAILEAEMDKEAT